MFSNRNRFILLFVYFFQIAVPNIYAKLEAEKPSQSENIYGYLAEMHLPTLAKEELKENEESAQIEKDNHELEKKWFKVGETVKIPALGDVEKLRQAYLIFGAQNKDANVDDNTCIQCLDKTTLEDLEIISGQKSKAQRHILALFKPYLHTAVGKILIQKMLSQPIINSEELHQTQDRIKQILSDIPELEKLNAKLKKLTSAENEFLWFWRNVSKSTFDQLEKSAVPSALPLPKFIMSGIEKKSSATEVLSKGSLSLKVLMNPLSWPTLVFGNCVYKYGWNASTTFLAKIPSLVSTNQDEILQFISDYRGILGFYGVLLALWVSTSTYQNIKSFADYNAATNSIHTKMNSVSQFIRASQKLIGLDATTDGSANAASLVKLLNTSTFKNNPSFFSYKGRAVSAFTLMSELKNHFVSMLEEVGKLDALVAIASFMHEQNNNGENCEYCFPDYIQADKPYIKLDQYWHPFISPEKVITNDIELGGNSAQNILVTGPNAGGKSTSTKNVGLAVILAQTLTIAPAKSMTLTPFKEIVTYMNIADDAGSESLFQAEMHRAADLIDKVKNQKPGEFVFVVMDELFTGTNPLEGKSAAYGIIKKLVNYNNMMLIFVTHFKELTELEKETNGAIKNYKVSVLEKAELTSEDINGPKNSNQIVYTYKLVTGISNQTIALDLLAQEGFDKDILNDSYTMLNRLKRQAN